MKLKKFLTAVLLLGSLASQAHDFTATVNGQRLCFEITNKTARTVAVTYDGSIADKKVPTVSGTVEIPAKIKHNDVVYNVKAIGRKAFANADRLKGIVIPAGVEEIGDFAFEDCDSLRSVVFPGNPVVFGQGVFFKCPEIADVTVGSDWKVLDLTMFRWSDRLAAINVPAKIEKIQGIKQLQHLERLTVDPNNGTFSSDNGMLYSKNGESLLVCPRARGGKIIVREGTVKIAPGALTDCVSVTWIDLPASLESVSFRETSRMKGLATIVLRNEKPILTGYLGDDGKFFFQLANPKAQLIVPANAKGAYVKSLATAPGEYSAHPGALPYPVSATELPSAKNIKGVKNFDKY